VSWDPPTAPISLNQSIDCEQLLQSTLNGESTIVADMSAFKLLEDVDLSVPNRISIQAVACEKDVSSKPQECTLLFGTSK